MCEIEKKIEKPRPQTESSTIKKHLNFYASLRSWDFFLIAQKISDQLVVFRLDAVADSGFLRRDPPTTGRKIFRIR